MRVIISLLPLISVSLAWAAIIPPTQVRTETAAITARDGVTMLSPDLLAAITPFAQFARAAYCPSSKLTDWACGDACSALPGFQVTLTGGDGDDVQLFYVGYWPQQKSVVVAHEGTDPTAFLSDLTDVKFELKNIDTSLFPGIPSDAQAHDGFLEEHAKTAGTILAEVQRLLSTTGSSTVTLIGHSLGGALAELDSLFLTLNLPSDVHIKAVTFGTPRVGNPQFASFFDSKVSDFERINNESDPIPTVPGRFLGFSHPHGEIHIVKAGDAVACPGDDDATDSQCTISTVPNIIESNILDHLGPYNDVHIGTIFCT